TDTLSGSGATTTGRFQGDGSAACPVERDGPATSAADCFGFFAATAAGTVQGDGSTSDSVECRRASTSRVIAGCGSTPSEPLEGASPAAGLVCGRASALREDGRAAVTESFRLETSRPRTER